MTERVTLGLSIAALSLHLCPSASSKNQEEVWVSECWWGLGGPASRKRSLMSAKVEENRKVAQG